MKTRAYIKIEAALLNLRLFVDILISPRYWREDWTQDDAQKHAVSPSGVAWQCGSLQWKPGEFGGSNCWSPELLSEIENKRKVNIAFSENSLILQR